MSADVQFPPCPASLKSIQHYLKTASEHDARDEVIAYWCRLYSLQNGLKIDKKSEEARFLLVRLMDWLELRKRELGSNEAITNEIAAQAHIENYALKVFDWATKQDKLSTYNKNVVKAYYTAGMLMDVLNTFGEVGDDMAAKCKFAKWRAAHIHSCLKNGELPDPAEFGEEDAGADDEVLNVSLDNNTGLTNDGMGTIGQPTQPSSDYSSLPSQPNFPSSSQPSFPPYSQPNQSPSYQSSYPGFPASSQSVNPGLPAAFAGQVPGTMPADTPSPNQSSTGLGGLKLDSAQTAKAQKYCKWAVSALNYEDIPEAISNLEKALHLLRTGQELC